MDIQREKIADWEEQIRNFAYPQWRELPEIDLYMDQVVGYLSQKLSVFYGIPAEDEENRAITATMINNYVKQKIIPAPQKKRYNRAHLSALLALFCVKQILSIGQSADFLMIVQNGQTPDEVYSRFCTVFETVLHYMDKTGTHEKIEELYAEEPVLTTTAVAFANRLYAEKLIGIAKECAKDETDKKDENEKESV